jgi:hypothetical protein
VLFRGYFLKHLLSKAKNRNHETTPRNTKKTKAIKKGQHLAALFSDREQLFAAGLSVKLDPPVPAVIRCILLHDP